MISYKGKDYETRQIIISPKNVRMPVTVAKMDLWESIKDKALCLNSEEMAIDSHICYYCNEREWKKSDRKLSKLLESL